MLKLTQVIEKRIEVGKDLEGRGRGLTESDPTTCGLAEKNYSNGKEFEPDALI